MDNRYVQQFKKGSLEMILLSLIGRRETYGYEIITELNRSASKGKEVLRELIRFWASYADCVNGFIAAYRQTEVSEE